jgi:hypothetical protein
MARLIYSESRGESITGKRGVARVVVNRQLKNLSEFGGSSARGVILNTPGGFVGMTTSDARCPNTGSTEWLDSLSVANDIGTNPVRQSLWFNTNTVFINQSRNGGTEYRFPGTSTYKSVVEKYIIGNHTFFRVSGY